MASTKVKPKKGSKGLQMKVKNLSALVTKVENQQKGAAHPDFSSGDTVKVHVRIKEGEKERIQIYEGVVIAQSRSSFNVRKISYGVGVERIFMRRSSKIAKIEVAHEGRVRRAKLYYLRGLEGKAARIEREVDATTASAPASKA